MLSVSFRGEIFTAVESRATIGRRFVQKSNMAIRASARRFSTLILANAVAPAKAVRNHAIEGQKSRLVLLPARPPLSASVWIANVV